MIRRLGRPRPARRSGALGGPALVAIALVLAGCSATGGGPILANPTEARPPAPPPRATPAAVADPIPIELPRDDGPHDRLTEWWYYTGHLATRPGDGPVRPLGFEYVIFRAERGAFPTSWVSHLAITDETGDAFHYTQRLEVGPQVDRSPRGVTGKPVGFDLAIAGLDPSDPSTVGWAPWTMAGGGGQDRLTAYAATAESGSPWVGALAGAVAGGLLASVHAYFVINRRSNQLATGLIVLFLGLGITSLFGAAYVKASARPLSPEATLEAQGLVAFEARVEDVLVDAPATGESAHMMVELDALIEEAGEMNFPDEEATELVEAQWLRNYAGMLGYLQLGFVYQGFIFLHETTTEWYERYQALLEDLGHVSVAPQGNKKLHTITPEGLAFLEENRAHVDAIQARMPGAGHGHGASGLRQSLHALKLVVIERARDGEAGDERLQRIQQILQRAADDVRALD